MPRVPGGLLGRPPLDPQVGVTGPEAKQGAPEAVWEPEWVAPIATTVEQPRGVMDGKQGE